MILLRLIYQGHRGVTPHLEIAGVNRQRIDSTSTQIHPPRVPAQLGSNVYAETLKHELME